MRYNTLVDLIPPTRILGADFICNKMPWMVLITSGKDSKIIDSPEISQFSQLKIFLGVKNRPKQENGPPKII
jgi:hypothetical protein